MLREKTILWFVLIGPSHAKTCLIEYANNKGADQPGRDVGLIDKRIVFLCIRWQHMSRSMTKPTKCALCAKRRLRLAWASAQSDQSLRFACNGKLTTQGFFMRTAKTLIRLGGCQCWYESSLGAKVILSVFDMRRLVSLRLWKKGSSVKWMFCVAAW